jgi:cytochrome c oxidase subunit I
MVFLFIIPGIPAALGNFVLPLIMLGAKDVAFPRLNLASYYLSMIGGGSSDGRDLLDHARRRLDTGWTFYTPYSTPTDHTAVLPSRWGLHPRLQLDLHRASTSSSPSTRCGPRA